MTAPDLVVVAFAMLVGLVGVLVPVVPGLLLIEATAIGWAVLEGSGSARWLVLALVSVILAVGTVLKYVVPSRSLRGAGAPRLTLLVGVALAVVGFFVVPLVGAALGFVVGVLLAEVVRLHDLGAAGRSTVTALKAIGLGMLVELTAGLAAISIWGLSVLVMHA